jgi:pimeloyl-ACP methyl ester carboxylesterase
MTPAIPHYTDVPAGVAEHLADDEDPAFADQVRERLQHFASVQSRPGNRDGDLEAVGDTEVTHRFVDAPGDSETVRWHLVEAGQGEPVVFVHGLPDSWYMWHRQLAALAATHRVIAVDLKGYGQSDKRTGDYRAEGVAEQLIALLDALGVDQFDLVAHDRGSVIADHIGAAWPARVLRYIRGEQHLWHFNPALAPQELLFTDPDRARILDQPHALVLAAYTLLATKPVEDADLARTIQEFAYPKISWAVPRYFNSSSFRKEWLDRRQRLIARWTFPTLVLQGAEDPRQPRQFYEGIEGHLPNARLEFLDCGHFFVLEALQQTTRAITTFLG